MKIFGCILIILTLLLTVFVGIKQPKMHTKIFVYNSDYEIVEENQVPDVETIKKTEELPTMSVDDRKSQIQIIFEEQDNPVVKVEVKTVEQPKTTTQTKQNKTEVQKKPQTVTKQVPKTTTTTKQVPKTTTTSKPVETKTVQNKQTKPQVTQTVQQKPQTTVQTQKQTPTQTTQTVVNTVPTQKTVKVLTAQEEEIAWNVWRSNLQNKIMRDAKLPTLPMGTVFKISFDVDKYGKITNLQTWSTDSRYTPYAIEFIAPVIKSYQGKSILTFPEGSQRTKTTFTGGWKIAATSKYSTPNDYHDTERVVK